MIFRRMFPVCSEENKSVEKEAKVQSHSKVGSHSSSFLRSETGMSLWMAEDDKRVRLLDPVIRGLARDDDIMHVALTQAGAADAGEARLLLQFRNAPGPAHGHAGAQSAHQLIHHSG